MLDSIPEDEKAPIQLLQTLRPTSALQEQLDSITGGLEGDERVAEALELMSGWARCGRLEMTEAAKAMYC